MTTELVLQIIAAYSASPRNYTPPHTWNIYEVWVKSFPHEGFPTKRNTMFGSQMEEPDIELAKEKLYFHSIKLLAERIDRAG